MVHSLLLASHSFRSISLGRTTSSLRSKSTTRTLVNSSSRYCFFSSAGAFFPLGFVLDFLQETGREGAGLEIQETGREGAGLQIKETAREGAGLQIQETGREGVRDTGEEET